MTTLLERDAGSEGLCFFIYLFLFCFVAVFWLGTLAPHKIRFLIRKLERGSGHWVGTEQLCHITLLFWSLE